MKQRNPNTGSVRLIDKKTRVVELLGPEPLGSRWPTDRKLFVSSSDSQLEYMLGPKKSPSAFRPMAGRRGSSSTRGR